ncbi:FAD dependent oxidoreductase superfamily [Hortaea werneckii]|nr:FAD dependent oxidoreductase superfamily [Hortaea werneckii]KAI7098131.1 FAD dependent oxidoreductase superfamily [Hortaea werneckii]KAI7239859.1 FAD dependent oxidoreductase superfamily [Hortaea werneckii]KAI7333171.1 FAD dependent oxidoreductase superfamily [Hortaea werneckii]KAI7406237.1 FAD dependent oxidoreductase superfamily [Hortaea werneckii]
MPTSSLPVANSTKPFWRSSPHELDNHRSTEQLPAAADIVIIGAGYAGASIAHHLLEQIRESSQKPTIVILEAREACSGATGRNGGHLKPDPYTRAAAALTSHGKEAAEEVASFEAQHLDEVPRLIRREGIDCDYVRTRAADVCLYQQGADEINAKIERLRQADISTVDDVFSSTPEKAEAASGIKGAKGTFTYTAGTIWPYKLILHLLGKAIARGVNLQTHTPVTSIDRSSQGEGCWKVKTYRGSIEAKKVVFATNAYSSALLPEFANHIVPVRGICSRIISPKVDGPFINNSYILRFNDYEYDYLIPRHDGSIVVGGARRDYYNDLGEWFGNSDDSKLMENAKGYFDGYMQRHFQGWEDSEAFTDSVWTGIMGYSSDGFPHVGAIPDKPGQFICAGFSGHGMPQVFLSAKAIATMIAKGKDVEEVDLPRLYRVSKERVNSQQEHATLSAWKRVFEQPMPKL